MEYTVFLVESAIEELGLLPYRRLGVCIRWMKKCLGDNPDAAGTALRGNLQGLRCAKNAQGLSVVFAINKTLQQVLVVCILPDAVSLRLKADEIAGLVRRIKPATRRSLLNDTLVALTNQPIGRAFEGFQLPRS